MSDLEAHEIRRMLGTPDSHDAWSLTRRRFLQASLAVGSATMLPSWFDKVAEAATPLGSTDGILVLVQLSGGNDGLRTVAPIGDAAYAGLRPTLAISPANALGLGFGLGLHPGLTTVKKYFDLGKVAVVTGVGDPAHPDLSHFTSMAKWMQGSATSASSGWLGRYMDGLGADPLTGISIGSDVPLQIVGDSVGQDGLSLAGRGLADTTRLASSPSDIWRDIAASNADELGAALDSLIAVLQDLRRDLPEGDRLSEVFTDAARWRASLKR